MQSMITGRIHVVGRGALSTLCSVLFNEAGLPVFTYGRGPDGPIRLSLLDSEGERICTVENIASLDGLKPSSEDLVFIGWKWPGLTKKLHWLGQLNKAGARVLLAQNGILSTLPVFSGIDNIYPVVAHVSASMADSYRVRVYNQHAFVIEDSLTNECPWICRAGFHGIPSDHFLLKQCIKLLIATTGARMALSGLSIGESLRSKEVCRDMAEIVREGITVLLKGVLAPHLSRVATDMANLQASFAMGTFLDKADLFMMEDATTSLHQDLMRRHGATEAPWINGWVVNEGERLQITTPLNKFLLETVEKMAIERRTPNEARKNRYLQERLSMIFASAKCSTLLDLTATSFTEVSSQ